MIFKYELRFVAFTCLNLYSLDLTLLFVVILCPAFVRKNLKTEKNLIFMFKT